MKRIKRHKVKTEKPESSNSRDHEEHDLAYYIHDRVELMHQVFSILKYKELKAMAPECVRNLAVGDLQELCTEELLGISSKRLLATLDGAEPPSDTESSSASPSPERMETISLDSISSDEEILSQISKKKKHKHHRISKSKSKKKEKQDPQAADETTEVSKASRAGLTVLELLELQARARAIRAQLQNEQAKKQSETAAVERSASTDDEVEIKEEAPDVVEISSGDEKPDLTALQLAVQKASKSKEPDKTKEPVKEKEPHTTKETETNKETAEKTTVTKRINDLTITVPQAKTTRKIKLKRNKVTVTIPNVADNIPAEDNRIVTIAQKPEETLDKSKKKKKKKKKSLEKDGSDHDEITLQLSDSEKMDLLEDLNEKNYDKLSSSSSDSEDSSSETTTEISTDSLQTNQKISERKDSDKDDTNVVDNKVQSSTERNSLTNKSSNSREELPDSIATSATEENTNKQIVTEHASDVIDENIKNAGTDDVAQAATQSRNLTENCDEERHVSVPESLVTSNDTTRESIDKTNATGNVETKVTDDEVVIEEKNDKSDVATEESTVPNPNTETFELPETDTVQVESNAITEELAQPKEVVTEHKEEFISITRIDDIPVSSEVTQQLNTNVDKNETIDSNNERERERHISEGEISDRESSEVEAVDVQPEVVCISDDEQQKTNKKKKKKEKKAKKEKKSKKSKQDFREGADQNFYKDDLQTTLGDINREDTIDVTEDDVYEILELSDDSSCYEVEGTMLSKEPTTEEIEALSARIDNIKKEDLAIDQPKETPVENRKSDSEPESEYISWRDRYLGSKKVKKVLTTANILNALRKKNKELKKKIEESKKKQEEQTTEEVLEGSIEHYQTLPPSKYITPTDPSKEVTEDTKNIDDKAATREMKKDAKQLLKMYRKLLNCRKEKRREKKKMRKQRKQIGNDSTSPVTSY